MDASVAPDCRQVVGDLLGYLNYSSGTDDPKIYGCWNRLFAAVKAAGAESTLGAVGRTLGEGLSAPDALGLAFATGKISQASAVIELLFDQVLPAYRHFHRDLLAHQSDDDLFGPFDVARAANLILAQGGPWNETERIVPAVVAELNSFVGYRPVPVLQTRRHEPYPHEWVSPVSLWLRQVGAAGGEYREVVTIAWQTLSMTGEDLLNLAYFDPQVVDEIAVDPRAYDFDHPVNRRPNHQFGQWDPHRLNQRGQYCRFVLQQTALEALLDRTRMVTDMPREELIYEAGVVLAGITLMSAAICGAGPQTHDSTTTLATLLPRVTELRDAFYFERLQLVQGSHSKRLREEARMLHQPFGGARQALNQHLARMRATQLQHVHLAQLYARIGFPEAASQQAQVVPVTSARLLCETTGRLTTAARAVRGGRPDEVAPLLAEAQDLLYRGIQCGALLDPWNILGFQGQFSLFPAVENSTRDHRVEVLTKVVGQIFDEHERAAGAAALVGNRSLCDQLLERLQVIADWWDQFATTQVSGVDSVSGRESLVSAGRVVRVLGAWHQAGEAQQDLGFWRKQTAEFDSPKAYARVAGTLIEHGDYRASMGLLMQWLSQADEVSLGGGDSSFAALCRTWLQRLSLETGPPPLARADAGCSATRWDWAKRFIDYLEANAGELAEVPAWRDSPQARLEDADPDTDEESNYAAAYEDVVYRDSTADGIDSELLEGDFEGLDDDLDLEARRLTARMAFLASIARAWTSAARLADDGTSRTAGQPSRLGMLRHSIALRVC